MSNNQLILLENIMNEVNIDSPYEYNGKKVPRTTEILSKCIHSDSLLYWANSLGFKRMSYSKTIAEAANIGTECHNAIDNFMDDNEFSIKNTNFSDYRSRNAYLSFMSWWEILNDNNIVEVIYHEHPLSCKYFGGTLDGLFKINGKIYLIDYKTSNHVGFRYFLQLASYRYMLREELGIEIDGCIVLQLNKENVSFNEYVLNFDIPDHLNYINRCEQAFLSIVMSYFYITKVENDFKNINMLSGGI